MACCMFAAFIVGHIVLMWRSVLARWFPARAAAQAAVLTASAWRPGMAITTAPVTTTHVTRGQQRLLTRTTGIAMIVVSLGYFAVQAKDALQQADDATSFAVLLAQNICRVRPEAKPATATQVAVIQPKTSNQTYFSVPDE